MLINSRVHKMLSMGKADYSIKAETYKRLAQEPFPGYGEKHLIIIEKVTFEPSLACANSVATMNSIEIAGALQDIKDWSHKDPRFLYFPVFVPVNSPKYLGSRSVFWGNKGLNLANSILSNISGIELAEGITHYLVRKFTPNITIELQAVIPGKIGEIWTETIAESDVSLDYYRDARPPLFYTWAGIIFKLWTVLINDDGNSHVIYREIGRHN